jgi:hypothetical protein
VQSRVFCPRDQALGLLDTSLSPAVTRMNGLAAAMVSFEESQELLRELAGVDVPSKTVERAAEALGREIGDDERVVVEAPPGSEAVAPTLYLGMDGTVNCPRCVDGRLDLWPPGNRLVSAKLTGAATSRAASS